MSILSEAIGAEFPDLQGLAESLMTLTLIAYEPNGTTLDADGYEVPDFLPRGTTPGKIQSSSAQGRDVATHYLRVGDTERPVIEAGLHIPTSATIPKAGHQRGIGWEYEVTEVGDNDDPALLGRRYLVVEVPAKTSATARRLDVVEV